MDNNVTVDFRVYGIDRGDYYSESNRCIINLNTHESIDDIFKTIQHELIHFCIDDLGENDDMDEDQEERLIFNMQWAFYSL
jgi:predicted SprT family Zn-dependent metalloprotease